MTERPWILIVDDDAGACRILALVLEAKGYGVETVLSAGEATAVLQKRPFDLVLLDIQLPHSQGLDLLPRLKERHSDLEVIVMTGYASVDSAMRAFHEGASGYVTKPLNMAKVLRSIREALEKQRLIRERRKTEETLRAYAAQLEARNAELNAFAHTVAHDLKNPLHHILSYAELLEGGFGKISQAEQEEYAQIIVQSVQKATNVIDELMLLAEVREASVEMKPLDVGWIVSEAEERLRYLIDRTGAEIAVPDKWPRALGYAPWVEEVWVNYIGNALKYGGRPPRVELGAELKNGQARFWVQDNGRGLTPEEQKDLFTPFTRLEQVQTEGYGLGLSIVRRIVDKLGGEVGVESALGEGSVFFFTLPSAQDHGRMGEKE